MKSESGLLCNVLILSVLQSESDNFQGFRLVTLLSEMHHEIISQIESYSQIEKSSKGWKMSFNHSKKELFDTLRLLIFDSLTWKIRADYRILL